MSNELVTSETYDFESAADLAQVWLEESDGDFTPEFPRIKVPSGGATTWEIDDDVAPTRELAGVVVAWHKSSRLYLESFESSDESSRRPDAWSTDGKVQIVPSETYEKVDRLNAKNGTNLPYPATDLSVCPYNKFIGDAGAAVLPGQSSGKANNEYRELFIVLRDAESVVPYQVSIPASSIKAWDGRGGYANGLITKGIRLATVETVLTLSKEKGPGSVEYSRVEFRRGNKLAPELKAAALAYSEGVKDFVKRDPFAVARAGAAIEAPAPQAALPAATFGENVTPQAAPAPETPAQEPAQEVAAIAEAFDAAPEVATEQVAVAAGSADDIDF
jgi:hypothetical protein